jgi:DNA-binding transcriptional ArsR family regulator
VKAGSQAEEKSVEISRHQASMCAALADYNRVLLLYAIVDEPQSVSQLAQRVGLTQPAVSHHLRIMRESKVVSAERHGKYVYYSVTDDRIVQAMDLFRSSLIDQMQQEHSDAHTAHQRPPV